MIHWLPFNSHDSPYPVTFTVCNRHKLLVLGSHEGGTILKINNNNENVEILSFFFFLFYRLPHWVKLMKLVFFLVQHLYCISVTINVLASVHLKLFHFNQMHLSAPSASVCSWPRCFSSPFNVALILIHK